LEFSHFYTIIAVKILHNIVEFLLMINITLRYIMIVAPVGQTIIIIISSSSSSISAAAAAVIVVLIVVVVVLWTIIFFDKTTADAR
jgi:hypothetical protein